MAGLEQQIRSHLLIGLDSSVFIYHIEAHVSYLPLTRTILNQIQAGNCSGIVSTVTIMEITVHPWRLNRPDIARQYEALLTNFPNLELADVTRDVARHAAQLRARHNLRPTDALLVGTAIANKATAWITNDKNLKRLEPELEVIILDDMVSH